MSNDTIVWLTVVLFVLHEFQEIIFIKPWVARYSGDPRMARHAFMAMKDVSTSAIAMMIGEEFLLFSTLCSLCGVCRVVFVFLGILAAVYRASGGAYCRNKAIRLEHAVASYERYCPAVVRVCPIRTHAPAPSGARGFGCLGGGVYARYYT
jgi:hypothetical protein